jgi:uncharacterized protein (DUF58 family)
MSDQAGKDQNEDFGALLAPSLMKKLDRMTIKSRKLYPGASMGERVTASRGSGMEFADYKEYSRGDDFRAIDWKVYARLNQFVVKTFETEENLPITLLVDSSSSMDFGGEQTKWQLASRLTAALGYIAMVSSDRLTTYSFADVLSDKYDATHGRGGLRGLLRKLSDTTPSKATDFAGALRLAAIQQRPGVCFVISDFCSVADLGDAFKALVFNGHEVTALHVWDPLEADPGLEGEVDLEDAETGELIALTVKGDSVQRYREAFEQRCRGVATACARFNVQYLRISTADSLEQVVINRFRRENVVR